MKMPPFLSLETKVTGVLLLKSIGVLLAGTGTVHVAW